MQTYADLSLDPADILERAARIVSEQGLAKNTLYDEERQVCHNGAISAAVIGLERLLVADTMTPEFLTAEEVTAINTAYNLSLCCLGETRHAHSITWWNDRPSTSAEDVALHLKRAAEHARAAECENCCD